MTSSVLVPSHESLKIHDLTPIEEYNGILYKREDKYMPFEDVPICGGKIRQALSIIIKNYDKIKNECDGLVATAASVNSPQGIIVSRCAKEFGFDSLIVFGATRRETLKTNVLIKWMIECGAKFDTECKIAYDTALNRRINQIESVRKLFHIKFGTNLESDPDAIVNSIAHQVQNLPNDLDNLIIPAGAAINAGGILCGLKEYNIKPKRVIIVQIAGYNRKNTLRKIFNILNVKHPFPEYEYVADKTYPYSKQIYIKLNDSEMFDPVYSAKAYEWMIKNINYKNEKTLLWLIGNSFYVRTLTPQMLRESGGV